MKNLKEMRTEKKLTQKQAAILTGVSLRTYKTYENDVNKKGTLKYEYLLTKLSEINQIDEEHGILDLEDIINKCADVFENYDVSFCYLFGSYAKNTALPNSDVDLLVDTTVSGLKFYGLVEELRTTLNKKVDVLDFNQLRNNLDLTREVLKEGVKIYDKHKG
ncbi:MAG: nucleotidyltransferase domain-containing protein [Erysipelotrichaceae bacterium]|nr:nucleotidyltransferase domain-containing protein [Erysipelotrichaceae bacterium]